MKGRHTYRASPPGQRSHVGTSPARHRPAEDPARSLGDSPAEDPTRSLGGLPPGRLARGNKRLPAKDLAENTARPRMHAPARSNTKKEGDLRREGQGRDRGEQKEERVLRFKIEKKLI